MCIASLVSSVVFIVLRYRINWREQVKRAFARIQEKEKKLVEFKKELQNETYKQSHNEYVIQKDVDDEDNYEPSMPVYNPNASMNSRLKDLGRT